MIVYKIGGASLARPETLDALADLLDGPAIVVHGGGPQLDVALADLEGPATKIDGYRVTSKAAASLVLDLLDGIGSNVARRLKSRGVSAQHVSAHKQALRANLRLDPPGLQRVGLPTTFNAKKLGPHASGMVHVITPVGWDDDGPLNINADDAAQAIAAAVGATKLVLITDVPHVRDAHGKRIASFSPVEAKALIGGAATGGMVPKIQAMLAAQAAGVPAVVLGTLESIAADTATTLVQP